MRKIAVATLLLLLCTVSAHAVCNPEMNPATCTVADAIAFYSGPPVNSAAMTAAVQQQVAKEVTNTNRATTAPITFAGRIHNSYEDFLNLLSFAINSVQEENEGQALVVRFNPLREGSQLLGTTLTLAEPEVGAEVSAAIPADVRDATVSQLQEALGDTDDVLVAIEYSTATADCQLNRSGMERCWGRSPSAYREITSAIISPLIPDPTSLLGDVVPRLQELFPTARNLMEATLDQATDTPLAIEIIKALVAKEALNVRTTKQIFDDAHLEMLATLIDNQPQISGTLSYHDRGDLGGPSVWGGAVELHWGRQNMNTLRAKCGANGGCMRNELGAFAANGLSTDKFVLTATYNRDESYKLDALPLETPVTGFVPIDLGQSDQFLLKAQGGRQLATNVMGEPMRADLSIEGQFNVNDGQRTDNRWVATLTFAVPIGDNMTIPLTVKYANKPAFLGEANDRIGTHIGISYRLPALFGSQ